MFSRDGPPNQILLRVLKRLEPALSIEAVTTKRQQTDLQYVLAGRFGRVI